MAECWRMRMGLVGGCTSPWCKSACLAHCVEQGARSSGQSRVVTSEINLRGYASYDLAPHSALFGVFASFPKDQWSVVTSVPLYHTESGSLSCRCRIRWSASMDAQSHSRAGGCSEAKRGNAEGAAHTDRASEAGPGKTGAGTEGACHGLHSTKYVQR